MKYKVLVKGNGYREVIERPGLNINPVVRRV